jgi:predicted kinase
MEIVITGPIASGKTTVARELARELERSGLRVAVIDLDMVYETLGPPGPKSDASIWTLARHAAAMQAVALLEQGVSVVIAEGSFNTPADRAAFADRLPAGSAPLYVSLRVSFEEALRRAQSDPTRGLSRDPAFLRPYFAAVGPALGAAPATDIVIDTEQVTAIAAAAAIAGHAKSRQNGLARRPEPEVTTNPAG